MSREREFAKNTIILALGRFLPQITSFITLPILTGCLTKSEYGTYDLIATLVMLLLPIATLQIQSAAFRFLIECRTDKKEASRIITNIFCVTIPVSVMCGIVVQFFFADYAISIRLLISIYLIFDTVQLTLAQISRGLGNNKVYSIASCALSFVNMVCIVISVFWLNTGLFGVLISLLVSQIVATVYFIYRIKLFKYINSTLIGIDTIKELLAYSWPMVPNNLSNWVLKLSDRLVITYFLGVEANAVYAVANKIPNLLALGQSVIVMAWQENASIAVHDKDADKYFTRMMDQVFSFMIGFSAVIIGFLPFIYRILIRGDYSYAYVQIPILILAMFFYCMSAFQGGIYVAHKKTNSVGLTTMFAAGINLLIDFLLVRIIGITAGSISTLVAYFALYTYRIIDSRKFQKMNYKIPKQVGLLAIIVCMMCISAINSTSLNILNMLLGCILCFILNKAFIWKSIKRVKSKL